MFFGVTTSSDYNIPTSSKSFVWSDNALFSAAYEMREPTDLLELTTSNYITFKTYSDSYYHWIQAVWVYPEFDQ
jgi:hypothetical protein